MSVEIKYLMALSGPKILLLENSLISAIMESNSQSQLHIISYNCNSIRKKTDVIRCLLKKCDVLILQEILLLPDDISFTEGIDENFNVCVIPSKYSQSDFHNGSSVGGMAVFWNTKLQISVNICDPHDHFILANISCDNNIFFA